MTNRNVFNCEAFDLQHISTLKDVKQFILYLVNEVKVNRHPDDSFVEYVDFKTGLPTFTMEEATIGNRLMDECFDVCKENSADIYELTMNAMYSLNPEMTYNEEV
jgi:hypothetical protein